MKNINFASIFLLLILLVSCSDFLDHDPKGVMDEDKFYKSPDAGYSIVVKCYKPLSEVAGFEAPRMDLGNMTTDDSEKGGSDAGDRAFAADLAFGRATSSNKDLVELWACMYEGIARCNTALENIPKRELVDADGYPITEEVKARYIGEVKFLRAFYYFELCKIFGGVPLINRTLTVADGKSLVRKTEAETAEFIIKDLQEASEESNIPDKDYLPAVELGRVTKEAVWSMQARVFMYFAKDNVSLFANARDAAKKVIDAKSCELEPNFQSLYLTNGYNSKESVFTNIRGDVPNSHIYGSFMPVYSSPRSCGAYGFDQPTQNLVDEFEEGDPRLLYTIVQNGDKFPKGKGSETLDFSTYPSTGYHNRKAFMVESRRGAGWGNDAWSFHIMRYADVLLMYAEAIIQTNGNKQDAVDCINLIRDRADKSRSGDTEATSRVLIVPNKKLKKVTLNDNLLDAIKHERRVELAMEYNRLYDLKRWNSYIETMNTFSTLPEANGRGATFKIGKNELFPIPQVEIDRTGGSIKQNPGYN